MTLQAVVFDFDGVILDTEWPIYEMAAATFAEDGFDLDVARWAGIVGLADESDWWARLCAEAGWELDRDDWWRRYRGRDRTGRDRLQPMAGVVDLLDGLAAADVPVGIASSSGEPWIDGHLRRVGLRDRFAAVVGVDRVGGVGKPAPDVYLAACRALGADPSQSVAIEDSAHGVAAAHAAGMAVVAVPNRITVHLALDGADRVTESLANLTVADLEGLV